MQKMSQLMQVLSFHLVTKPAICRTDQRVIDSKDHASLFLVQQRMRLVFGLIPTLKREKIFYSAIASAQVRAKSSKVVERKKTLKVLHSCVF